MLDPASETDMLFLPALCFAKYLSLYCFFFLPNQVQLACCSCLVFSMAMQATRLVHKERKERMEGRKEERGEKSNKVNHGFMLRREKVIWRLHTTGWLSLLSSGHHGHKEASSAFMTTLRNGLRLQAYVKTAVFLGSTLADNKGQKS